MDRNWTPEVPDGFGDDEINRAMRGDSEYQKRAEICVEACKDIPNPEGLAKIIDHYKLIAEGESRFSVREKSVRISVSKQNLRACGIEPEPEVDGPDIEDLIG